MFDDAGPIVRIIFSGAAVFAALSYYGYFIDGKISAHYREAVYKLMNRISNDTWPQRFLDLHSTIFRSSRTGRPHIGRLSIASLTATGFLAIVWSILHWPDLSNAGDLTFLVILIFYSIPINLVGDYFSCWESHFIISRMTQTKSVHKHLLLLLFDFIASVIIFLLGLIAGTLIFVAVPIPGNHSDYSGGLFYELLDGVTTILLSGGLIFYAENELANIFGIVFFTTLFTSIWTWAFTLGITL